MRIKLESYKQGLHPNELIVILKTLSGSEKLVVHKRSIKDNTINVGHPIEATRDGYLVELPTETTTGAWRVWVPKDNTTEATAA
jgi:hypothetical protein